MSMTPVGLAVLDAAERYFFCICAIDPYAQICPENPDLL